MSPPVVVRPWRVAEYLTTLQAMREFTARRTDSSADELWLIEHPPVFTQGIAGKPEHILAAGNIPVIQTERGGQVTYHGPGQVIIYLLLDLQRRKLGPRALVSLIEDGVIALLNRYKVPAIRKSGAPGVYVTTDNGDAGAKIAALGIKVSRGCSYHGVALNAAMDLAPFEQINPCGYAGLAVTDLQRELQVRYPNNNGVRQWVSVAALADEFADVLSRLLKERAPP